MQINLGVGEKGQKLSPVRVPRAGETLCDRLRHGGQTGKDARYPVG